MIESKLIAEGLVAWARATLPELKGGYDYAASQKIFPLPDVAAEPQRVEIVRTDSSDFPHLDVEQIPLLRVHRFHLLLLVPPDPGDTATELLESFVDRLTTSMLTDNTLGNRVPGISPLANATYTPPFVEFDDRTKGRLATMELTIGDILEPMDSL